MSKFMSNIVFWQIGLLLLLCLNVIGLRVELISFKAFTGIFGATLLLSLLLAFIILFKFIVLTHANIRYAALGLIMAIASISTCAYLLKQVITVPPIHDISTNLTDIPQFTKTLGQRKAGNNSLAYSEKVARQQRTVYPALSTLISTLPLSEALKKSAVIARQLDWKVHFIDTEKGLIEATDTSTLFGFVDDIIIRVREVDNNTISHTHIDIRSASRVGESDLGANAKRIKIFMGLFNP